MTGMASVPLATDRLNSIPLSLRKAAGQPSAVLVGLMERRDGWHVIMTERAHHLSHHAGQIAFPGGKVDASDPDLVATALREADEEVALPRSSVEILGGLDTVKSPVGFVVQPVVGLVDPAVTLRAAPDEVAQVLVLPLAPLVDPQRHVRRSYIRDGRKREVWVIEDNRYNIWGLSASILVDLGRRMAPAMSGGGLLRAEDMTGTGGD